MKENKEVLKILEEIIYNLNEKIDIYSEVVSTYYNNAALTDMVIKIKKNIQREDAILILKNLEEFLLDIKKLYGKILNVTEIETVIREISNIHETSLNEENNEFENLTKNLKEKSFTSMNDLEKVADNLSENINTYFNLKETKKQLNDILDKYIKN